jgi:uncharacterized membrane protein YeiH
LNKFLELIDILGVATFAIAGAYAAMQKRLDVFGILIISFITALGGGTLRDVMIGDLPVSWMRDIDYCVIILAASTVAMVFNKYIRNFQTTLLIFDSLGLGFFTILGVKKGILFGFHPGICVALGTITGCFGGVIRDISLNNIPLIFQREIYATACIVGGIAYVLLLRLNMNNDWIEVISISIIFLIRIIAVAFKLTLPGIYGKKRHR